MISVILMLGDFEKRLKGKVIIYRKPVCECDKVTGAGVNSLYVKYIINLLALNDK